eukprot:1666014-Amphidinium_carterae.1
MLPQVEIAKSITKRACSHRQNFGLLCIAARKSLQRKLQSRPKFSYHRYAALFNSQPMMLGLTNLDGCTGEVTDRQMKYYCKYIKDSLLSLPEDVLIQLVPYMLATSHSV